MQSVQEVNPTDINLNFLNDVDKLHEDIIMLRANVNDSIIMGNSINVSYVTIKEMQQLRIAPGTKRKGFSVIFS